MALSVTFERLFRTPQSEQWKILDDDDQTVGRVDVHFSPTEARVTVVVSEAIEEGDLDALVSLVDERLVPEKTRADVRVALWRGESAGTFAP